MDHDQFVGRVQHRCRVATRKDAIKAIRSTLETLGERLTDDETRHPASQLPEEIDRFVVRKENPGKFDLEDFYQRVAEREDVDYPLAVFHARAVMSVVDEAVQQGEMDDVRTQLPPEFGQLFAFEDILAMP